MRKALLFICFYFYSSSIFSAHLPADELLHAATGQTNYAGGIVYTYDSNHEAHLLLGLRRSVSFFFQNTPNFEPGFWTSPGGGSEPCDLSDEAAAAREIEDELLGRVRVSPRDLKGLPSLKIISQSGSSYRGYFVPVKIEDVESLLEQDFSNEELTKFVLVPVKEIVNASLWSKDHTTLVVQGKLIYQWFAKFLSIPWVWQQLKRLAEGQPLAQGHYYQEIDLLCMNHNDSVFKDSEEKNSFPKPLPEKEDIPSGEAKCDSGANLSLAQLKGYYCDSGQPSFESEQALALDFFSRVFKSAEEAEILTKVFMAEKEFPEDQHIFYHTAAPEIFYIYGVFTEIWQHALGQKFSVPIMRPWSADFKNLTPDFFATQEYPAKSSHFTSRYCCAQGSLVAGFNIASVLAPGKLLFEQEAGKFVRNPWSVLTEFFSRLGIPRMKSDTLLFQHKTKFAEMQKEIENSKNFLLQLGVRKDGLKDCGYICARGGRCLWRPGCAQLKDLSDYRTCVLGQEPLRDQNGVGVCAREYFAALMLNPWKLSREGSQINLWTNKGEKVDLSLYTKDLVEEQFDTLLPYLEDCELELFGEAIKRSEKTLGSEERRKLWQREGNYAGLLALLEGKEEEPLYREYRDLAPESQRQVASAIRFVQRLGVRSQKIPSIRTSLWLALYSLRETFDKVDSSLQARSTGSKQFGFLSKFLTDLIHKQLEEEKLEFFLKLSQYVREAPHIHHLMQIWPLDQFIELFSAFNKNQILALATSIPQKMYPSLSAPPHEEIKWLAKIPAEALPFMFVLALSLKPEDNIPAVEYRELEEAVSTLEVNGLPLELACEVGQALTLFSDKDSNDNIPLILSDYLAPQRGSVKDRIKVAKRMRDLAQNTTCEKFSWPSQIFFEEKFPFLALSERDFQKFVGRVKLHNHYSLSQRFWEKFAKGSYEPIIRLSEEEFLKYRKLVYTFALAVDEQFDYMIMAMDCFADIAEDTRKVFERKLAAMRFPYFKYYYWMTKVSKLFYLHFESCDEASFETIYSQFPENWTEWGRYSPMNDQGPDVRMLEEIYRKMERYFANNKPSSFEAALKELKRQVFFQTKCSGCACNLL